MRDINKGRILLLIAIVISILQGFYVLKHFGNLPVLMPIVFIAAFGIPSILIFGFVLTFENGERTWN